MFRTNVQQAAREELNKTGESYAPIYQESRKGLEQYTEAARAAQQPKKQSVVGRIDGVFSN